MRIGIKNDTRHIMAYRKGGKDLKEKFLKPSFCEVRFSGPLTNDELAALPDDELAAYLREHGYYEAKQRALDAQKRSEKCENNEQF